MNGPRALFFIALACSACMPSSSAWSASCRQSGWIEAVASHEASFHFCATVNGAAAAGLWIMASGRA